MDYLENLSVYSQMIASTSGKPISQLRIEHHFECLDDRNLLHNLDSVKDWFLNQRERCDMSISEIPINNCRNWSLDPNSGVLSHDSGEFFTVHGIRIDFDGREVGKGGWDQPIMTQVGFDGGLLGILRQRFSGVPHYLIEAKAEPGNFGQLQLSPTLQATFSNLKMAHKGSEPRFSDIFTNLDNQNIEVLYNQWMSEDGGRLYLKRNRGILVEVPEGHIEDIPENYIWLSMWQIKELLLENAWVNPHVRGIISNL